MNRDDTIYMFANLNLANNELGEFRVHNIPDEEDLESLPKGKGGMVFYKGSLWVCDGAEWIQVCDSAVLINYQLRSEKDQAGGYLGIGEDSKVLVQFLPTGNGANTLPLIRGEISDGQSLKFSAEDGGFIAFEISTLYTYRGSCSSMELDLKTDAKIGDVWNLTDDRVWKGKRYQAGTSWAWEGEGWEPLAGTLDLEDYQLIDNMVNDLLGTTASDTTYPTTQAVVDYVTAKRTPVINDWQSASQDNVASAELVKVALDNKTDVTMAICPWDQELTYQVNSTVIRDNTLYISLQSSNTGNDPILDVMMEWWMPVQGGGGGTGGNVRAMTQTIGNGTDTVFDIVHGFQTSNVFVNARTSESPSVKVDVDVEYTTPNSIKISFTNPPAVAGIVVSLIAADSSASTGDTMVYAQTEPAEEWVIQHDFGTWAFVQVYGMDGDQMMADVKQSEDLNSVTIGFGVPMAGMAVVASAGVTQDVTVLTGTTTYARTISLGDAKMVSLDNASGTVNVVHNKGRLVLVQIYDISGNEIKADIIQDMQSLNSVTVNLNNPVTGTVIIL